MRACVHVRAWMRACVDARVRVCGCMRCHSDDLMAVGKELGDCPAIKIKVDYNTTRIAAVHGLLISELRLSRALKAYDLKYSPGWSFGSGSNTSDWQIAAEFEAVLNCTRITSSLAQLEKKYMAASTMLIK